MKLGYLEGPAMTCHNSVHRLYSKMTRKGQGLLHYIVLLAIAHVNSGSCLHVLLCLPSRQEAYVHSKGMLDSTFSMRPG